MNLSISAAFDSGNIRLVGIDGDRIDLEIVKDHQSDFYQWFHFRIANAAGRELTLRITNAAGSTDPGPTSSPELASAQKQLKVVQWVIPALTGTLLVLGAQQGEQQRPANLVEGIRARVSGK